MAGWELGTQAVLGDRSPWERNTNTFSCSTTGFSASSPSRSWCLSRARNKRISTKFAPPPQADRGRYVIFLESSQARSVGDNRRQECSAIVAIVTIVSSNGSSAEAGRLEMECQLPTPLNYSLFARWRNAPISSIGDCASPPTANQGGLAGCECAPSFPGTVSLPTQSVAKEVTRMLNGPAVLQRRGCVTVLVVREQQ